MQREPRYSCVFVGEKTLLLLCAEYVLSRGHFIRGIAAENAEIQTWAHERSIPIIEPRIDRLTALLSNEPCDFLLSVMNDRVLPEDVLRLPQQGAINFHDGPLPRYCGMWVTTWALIHQERDYGVSWHQMTGKIDGGCLLMEKPISVADDDTSATLNTKCFEAGFESFQSLWRELEQGTVVPRHQESARRCYFARRKRPGRMAVFDWARPAEELDALFRGLDFGRFDNQIGCPKVLWGDRVLVPGRLKLLERPSTRSPGTVETVPESGALRVNTSTRMLELADFHSLDGHSVSVSALPTLPAGEQGLPKLNGDVSPRLHELWERICVHERYWLPRLIDRDPVALPYVPFDIAREEIPGRRIRQQLDCRELFDAGESPSFAARAVATVSLYAGRLSGSEAFDLDYRGAALHALPAESRAFFATAVPIKLRLEWSDTFAAHVRQVEEALSQAERHETFSRDLVVRYSQITDEHRRKLREIPDLAVTLAPAGVADETNLPAAQLLFAISPSEPAITLLANAEVIHEELLLKIAGEFQHLLWQTFQDPDGALASFDVVTPAEQALLHRWNDETIQAYEADTLPCAFEAQVEKTPEATALVFRGQSLTYGELNARANQLAHLLAARGVKRGDLVGVLMDRSIEMVVALFGVLKAGAAYLPLDPRYPTDRLAVVAKDSAAAFFITQPNHLRLIEAISGEKLIFEGPPALSGCSTANPAEEIEPGAIAYVMYTSGSTERPSGVMITHKNIANLFHSVDRTFGRQAGTCLAVTSISFDISVLELFWSLTRGFRVVLFAAATSSAEAGPKHGPPEKKLDFSLFLSGPAGTQAPADRPANRLPLEAARFAEERDFAGIRSLDDFTRHDLPRRLVWIPSNSDSDAFRRAGQAGAPILTEVFGKSVESVAQNIALYRRTWRGSGHAGDGRVALLLHALVGDDEETVKNAVREPITDRLKREPSLLRDAAWEFPPFVDLCEQAGKTLDDFFAEASPEQMRELLEFAFERLYATGALLGTPAQCRATVARLQKIGVDEIACLIDFGLPAETILEHLPALGDLRLAANPSDEDDIPAAIERHQVTHLFSTPSRVTTLTWNERGRRALARLQLLVCGGEPMSEALARQLRSSVGGRVINIYGPTETTVFSTSHEVTGKPGPVPIGRPVANTQIHVVDKQQRPLPIGVPGELVIGGGGVGAGYRHNPELTAARFAKNGHDRLYRTGDIVRLRRDGVLEFLGRLDDQVKIRGHRVELGEIESAIQSAPGVRHSVVHPQEDSAGGKRLVAYVVPVKAGEFSESELRAFLQERLPDDMVPSLIELVDDLPLTPSGKVNRRALPKPSCRPRPGESGRSSPPRLTATQSKLVELWKKLLDVPDVGLGDNFFDLGGHSLLSMRAISEIEAAFGVRISNRIILVSTLDQTAAEIDRSAKAARAIQPKLEGAGLGRLARWFKPVQ